MNQAYSLIAKLRDQIPRIYTGTVMGLAPDNVIHVAMDQATDVSVPATSIIGVPAVGTRVKCLAYPPRGLLIFGVLGAVFSFDTLRVTSNEDASLTSTNHPFQVGTDGNANIRIDGNEILAVSSAGLASSLHLQTNGGRVEMFDQVDGTLDLNDSGYVSTVMEHKWDTEPTNQANYNSTVANAGTADAGFTFIAPPSGAGTFQVAGFGRVNVAGMVGKYWGEIRTGGTIGSGTLVHDGDGDSGPQIRHQSDTATSDFYIGSGSTLVTGLTPGNTYNASGWFAVVAAGGAGAGVQMFARQLSWIPSP